MIITDSYPKKWKKAEGYGRCMICEKWEEVMYFLMDDIFYILCERDFYELGDD